jgi:NAD+ synthase
MKPEMMKDWMLLWIRSWFNEKGADSKAVIGLSGGKDSTVCAYLLTQALGKDRVVPVLMPNGDQADIDDSYEICKLLDLKPVVMNIKAMYSDLMGRIENAFFTSMSDNKLFTTNTPARLRMVTLYGIAAAVGGFVCNTCNRSEDYVGYSTKYGDSCGDFSLLANLTVTQVYELADVLGVPEKFGHKTPSDGMCGKSDEDNMGFTYAELDKYIETNGRDDSITPEVREKIVRMHQNPNTALKMLPMKNPFGNVSVMASENTFQLDYML